MNPPIYLLGDHHGTYQDLLVETDRIKLRDAILVHVGDGEEGYDGLDAAFFRKLSSEFGARGIEYLSIRGNHSNPVFFNGDHIFDNVKLLPDYTRREWHGQNWLFVGGAVSINRLDRVRGKTWWPEEAFALNRKLAGPADVLVTHSGPTWIIPPQRNAFVAQYCRDEKERGKDLRKELRHERNLHDELFNLVRPKFWYLGHFHQSLRKTQYGCRTRILNCSELARHRV